MTLNRCICKMADLPQRFRWVAKNDAGVSVDVSFKNERSKVGSDTNPVYSTESDDVNGTVADGAELQSALIVETTYWRAHGIFEVVAATAATGTVSLYLAAETVAGDISDTELSEPVASIYFNAETGTKRAKVKV